MTYPYHHARLITNAGLLLETVRDMLVKVGSDHDYGEQQAYQENAADCAAEIERLIERNRIPLFNPAERVPHPEKTP